MAPGPAAAGAVLVWLGYLLGGRQVARWIIVAFALAATIGAIPAVPSNRALILGAGLVGAAAGAVAWRYADRLVPWDAFGIVVTAGPLGLLVAQTRAGTLADQEPLTLLLIGTVSFTVTGSILRLLPDDRPRARLPFASAVVIGFAALVTGARYLNVPLRPGQPPFNIVVIEIIMCGAAVAVALLWGVGRVAARIRRDIRAEAEHGSRRP